MNLIPKYLILITFTLCMACAPSARADNFQKLLRTPSASLLDYAKNYTERDLPDSALFCYTVIAERYNPKMSREEKLTTYRALLGRWGINFSYLGNYREAAEDLVTADRIQKKGNLSDTRLIYAKGISDMALGAQNEDLARLTASYDNLRKAYWQALDEKDEETRFLSIFNMMNLPDMTKDVSLIRKEMESLEQHPFTDPNLNTLIRLNYEGSLANANDNSAGAINAYTRIANLPLKQKRYASYINNGRTKLAQILIHVGQYAEADSVLDYALALKPAISPSQRLSVIWLKRVCAERQGDQKNSLRLYSDYLELKDSLQSYNMTVRLDQMRFTDQLRRINTEKEQLKQQKHVQATMLVIALLIILAGAVVIWFVVRTNARLRSARDIMYRRVHELNQYQQALTAKENVREPEETHPKTRSQLPEETEEKIGAGILHVIASDEIFSPDFSLEHLAELVGSRPRITSQVINSRFNRNFWSLVNEARIREACRRIDDMEHYGGYSTEAIAESVGFNSRSSFCAAFKKFTGLGVGEYRRMSRKRNNQQNPDY